MELWIPITIAAAFAQNLRFMLQKQLKSARFTSAGATFARFVFSAPLAVLLAWGYGGLVGGGVPAMPAGFWAYAIAGGLSQIAATLCVVTLLSMRNFTVGITLKKTEVILTALLGLILLGEGLPAAGLLAILAGFTGVVLLSDPPATAGRRGWRARVFNRAAAYGVGAGALFGVSAVGYRGATLALGHGDFFLRAVVTLAVVTTLQTVVMALWMGIATPQELRRVIREWRVAGLVGLTSMAGSLGWFSAFALQNAAYVKALGQIELIFTFFASHYVFREVHSRREIAGIALVVASILILVLLG